MSKQSIIGSVKSGNELDPVILESTVYLINARLLEAEVLCMTQSDENGRYSLSYEPKPDQFLYIIAEATKKVIMGNKVIRLMTIVNSTTKHVINELTTVASIWALAQFYDHKSSTYFGNLKGLEVARGMAYNITTEGGDYSKVISKSPNANETNSLQTVNSLCNLLAYVIRNMPKYLSLSALTQKSKHTLDVFNYIATNPALNVQALYNLSSQKIIYTNPLKSQPDAFTIAIKVNRTGNDKYFFGGPGNLVFDKNGYAWITNNAFQTTNASSNFVVVLQPNGQPADFSPVFGGGIFGSAFGITIDNDDNVLIGNFGWGDSNPVEGSVTKLNLQGKVLSPTNKHNGFTNEIERVQGLKVDQDNNIWMCSFENNRIVVYVNGDENDCIFYQLPDGSGPYDLVINKKGEAICTTSGGANEPSIIFKLKLFIKLRNITMTYRFADEQHKPDFVGITKDINDNVYVSSFSKNAIYKLDDTGNLQNILKGGGVCRPWGCHVDGEGNVLVANFMNEKDQAFGISYFDVSGNPLSPSTGFTLTTGGDEVLLPDGSPLFKNGEKCMSPLMKQTGINVDAAGNVWVCNNCKPSLSTNVINPGGDGIVIFLGLAKPISQQ
jgi:hypothetical protein